MRTYRVSLHKELSDRYTVLFDCQADDEDHAKEQALNAFPEAEILIITDITNL